MRACEHCGKWQSSKICRKDRRRLREARAAVAATFAPPWYVRAWRALCRPFLVLAGLVAFVVFLFAWDESDPHW